MIGKAAFFTNTDGRKGADEDKRNFETMFWKHLGFEPLTGDEKGSSVVNLTKEEWNGSNSGKGDCSSSWVNKLKNIDFKECQCVLLAFSSHGHEAISRNNVREPALRLNDKDQLYLSDVLETLSDISELRGKPKIILWICCRYFTKYVEEFQQSFPKSSPTQTGCPATPDIEIEIETDKAIIFKCKKEVDVTEYEIQYSQRDTSDVWSPAKVSVSKEENESVYFLVENLQPDTEYCFVIQAKNKNDLYSPFAKKHTRTFEQEDVGVCIREITENPKQENLASTSQDKGDGLGFLEFLPQFRKKDKSKEKASNNSDHDCNTNTSAQPIPLEEGNVVDVRSSKAARKFIVSKVDESEVKEVFSADHIPNDFLIVFGTTRGGFSKRNENRGSWAVSSLADVIQEERADEDLNFFHILTKSAQKMSEKSSVDLDFKIGGGKKSIMCFSHSLTEPIYFKKKSISKPAGLGSDSGIDELAKKLKVI